MSCAQKTPFSRPGGTPGAEVSLSPQKKFLMEVKSLVRGRPLNKKCYYVSGIVKFFEPGP